jgi:hypothetical protein
MLVRIQMREKTLPQVRRAHLRSIDRTKEIEWIARHRNEYLGEWVILHGDRLLAHGSDPQPLLKQVRAQGVDRPLVIQIEEKPRASMGGWL